MKNYLKQQKGITLIALVITIIVLLILAGVTIAMLSGENGILNRAQQTRGTDAYYSAEEQVKLAYMTVKTEIMAERTKNGTYNAASEANTTALGTKVANELKTSDGWTVNYSTAGKIAITYTNSAIKEGQISESPKKPSENGKVEYEIGLLEKDATLKIDGIEVNSGTSGGSSSWEQEGDDPLTPTGKSVTELNEGEEVIYTDQNGNTIPCIVLYDSTGSNGIQIITKDLVKDSSGNDITIELGNGTGSSEESTDENHFATAKESYNTAIAILNNAARGYLNTNIATNARCVGSSPSETPITSEDNTGTFTNSNSYFSSYNNQFKKSSANHSSSKNEDWLQMKTLNCHNISKGYWIASRGTSENQGLNFNMDFAGGDDYYRNYKLCRVDKNKGAVSYSYTKGLRPIFTLISNIHYVDDGTTKTLVK